MSQSECSSVVVAVSKSRWESLNHEDPILKRMDMWLSSCNCDTKSHPYCTYCEILWDARERLELLESLLMSRSFDEGMKWSEPHSQEPSDATAIALAESMV